MAAMAFSLGEKVLYEDSKAYQHIMFVYPTRVDQHYQITKSLFEPPNPPDYWVPESRLQGLVVKNPSWAQGQIEAATRIQIGGQTRCGRQGQKGVLGMIGGMAGRMQTWQGRSEKRVPALPGNLPVHGRVDDLTWWHGCTYWTGQRGSKPATDLRCAKTG
eukprot:symbB.v1.2.004920.t3/scaffold281.1/size241006/1